jgi:hypothetical protein
MKCYNCNSEDITTVETKKQINYKCNFCSYGWDIKKKKKIFSFPALGIWKFWGPIIAIVILIIYGYVSTNIITKRQIDENIKDVSREVWTGVGKEIEESVEEIEVITTKHEILSALNENFEAFGIVVIDEKNNSYNSILTESSSKLLMELALKGDEKAVNEFLRIVENARPTAKKIYDNTGMLYEFSLISGENLFVFEGDNLIYNILEK